MCESILSENSQSEIFCICILPQTQSRFKAILKRKKDALLSHTHMKFSESIFDSLPHFHDKIKVSFRNMKTFGPYSAVATRLVEIADDLK